MEHFHIPMLLLIGFALFFGTVGGRIFTRLRIPQVVGYIVMGLIVGRSGLGIIDGEAIDTLRGFNFFALGIIGFMIGGELHREVFQKYGKQFMIILLAEGLGAFVVVGTLVAGLAFLLGLPIRTAVALGLVLGAISSATAPAATVDVLWEYKTRGILTTTVFAIVALDDGLAMVLYGIASSIATILTGHGDGGVWGALFYTVRELLGAVVLGTVVGLILNVILRRSEDRDKSLVFIIGALAIVLGAAQLLEVDIILSAMALGTTLVNLVPKRSNKAFQIVEGFAPPIYVLFFVIVGARLYLGGMETWMWVLAGAYVAGRTGGKFLGAYLGARWSKSSQAVRKYLGFCLFSQAGVAIGLSILASDRFTGEVGTAIIAIVTATTFLVQIIGPPSVKFAAARAGEVGLNVTEEDLARTYHVTDMLAEETNFFTEGTPLAEVLQRVAATEATCYGVVDSDGNLSGVITIEEFRKSVMAQQLSQWLVAYDFMQAPPEEVATREMTLTEAVSLMNRQAIEYVPVVESAQSRRLLGVVELRGINRFLSGEVLTRRQRADGVPA